MNPKSKVFDDADLDSMLDEFFSPPQSKPLETPTTVYDEEQMPFGKYKGKSFKEIFESDKNYCLWCIESLAVEKSKGGQHSSTMLNFVTYCKKQFTK